ncbi:MAG: zinc ribbon domain-containing protein [Chloroflexi bacterium]|nr:zinc ribbon domain-containing protein [Chloroflexota bacterium]
MSQLHRIIVFVFLLTLLLLPLTGFAQTDATAIDTMMIDFWPDYDRPAVLILLTGTLPEETPLPAAVTIPLPESADLNAVARITDNGMMRDDIEYTNENGMLSFTTPDARFRVEYYLPYSAAGNQRELEFTWLADTAVNNLKIAVQQPAAAANVQTQPPAVSTIQNSLDDLTYHNLPETAVPAGTPYTVQLSYTMNTPTLSVEQAAQPAPPPTEPVPVQNQNLNWPLILAISGGVLVVIAVVWQMTSSRRQPKRPHKASPKRRPKTAAKFCHECGVSLQSEDKFCRECGTAVKKRK